MDVKKAENNQNTALTGDFFFQTYSPIENTISKSQIVAGQNEQGDEKYYGYETYGPDWDHVLATHDKTPNNVWTMIDADLGVYIVAGLRRVDAVCYLITEMPWTDPSTEFLDVEYGDNEFLED